MIYTINEKEIPQGRQKYFFVAIKDNNEIKTIKELSDKKFTGQKTIDIYTSESTKEEIIQKIENQMHIKIKAIRLAHIREDKKIELFGIVLDNKEFARSIKNFPNNKVNHINVDTEMFLRELHEFENTIENNLKLIKDIYGLKSSIYAKACNYKENNQYNYEHRNLLIEEFSQYINFRKWLTRNTKVIYPKIEKNLYPEQITITEYMDNLPSLKEEKKLTIEKLQHQKEQLLRFNRKDEEKEEFLEMDDFERSTKDDVEDWKPRKWKVRKK